MIANKVSTQKCNLLISHGDVILNGPTPFTSLIQTTLGPFHPGRPARKLEENTLEIS